MNENEKPDFLYHGSLHRIEGFITRHRGRNQDCRKELNQYGVYATPDYATAMVYALGAQRTTFFRPKIIDIKYSYDSILVDFQNCCWNKKTGYVYKVNSEAFTKINDFEYCANSDLEIIETTKVSLEQINDLIDSGKIIFMQGTLPKSLFVRFLFRLIDGGLRCVRNAGHFFNKIWYAK